jgi:hypothetical protein
MFVVFTYCDVFSDFITVGDFMRFPVLSAGTAHLLHRILTTFSSVLLRSVLCEATDIHSSWFLHKPQTVQPRICITRDFLYFKTLPSPGSLTRSARCSPCHGMFDFFFVKYLCLFSVVFSESGNAQTLLFSSFLYLFFTLSFFGVCRVCAWDPLLPRYQFIYQCFYVFICLSSYIFFRTT